MTTNCPIADFTHHSDRIGLENAVYRAIGSSWSAAQFVARANDHSAQTTHQHVIYDKADGTLWYDDDGKGAHAAIEFAVLSGLPSISAADFLVI